MNTLILARHAHAESNAGEIVSSTPPGGGLSDGGREEARLLGAEVTLVGIRPEVADALVSLNLDTRSIQSYSSLQMALQSSRSASAHA